jgi:hypothetical protein
MKDASAKGRLYLQKIAGTKKARVLSMLGGMATAKKFKALLEKK